MLQFKDTPVPFKDRPNIFISVLVAAISEQIGGIKVPLHGNLNLHLEKRRRNTNNSFVARH